ncbi:MAG TPA: Na(+)-translocating NADH-quinone reductase subunit A [Candidatus Omnitrophota bacterium]|nr:Na(+)-translocating NADH-quinone reductase subunit A [Candidatus Omnitrophota bacterium]
MAHFQIRKGRDIKLKGAAEKRVVGLPLPSKVAIQPLEFRGLKLRPAVKEQDLVKVGSVLLTDKYNPDIRIVSPVSGKVAAIVRGEKRVLTAVIIDTDGRQEATIYPPYSKDKIGNLSREEILSRLLEGGVWPCIRQRPFSKVANPHDTPKAVFVQAMNTEPLAPDIDVILKGREEEFQAGLDVLRKLTPGDVHLCCDAKATSPVSSQSKNVRIHQFSGPHPAGNVSTHIHHIAPIKKGDIVWYVRAEDVLRVAALFLKGVFSPERYVAITGEGADRRLYAKTVVGASVSSLLEGKLKADMRYISGSILVGTNAGQQGYLGFYDSQITVIPEGGKRHLLGWLNPGFKSYSFSKTFVSSFLPQQEVSVDTDINGSERAIVLNHVYDQYVPLDIMTFFLLRAVVAGDIEEAEKLGILECDEEDFALCSFACPSKVDVGAVIRGGLDEIEKEG